MQVVTIDPHDGPAAWPAIQEHLEADGEVRVRASTDPRAVQLLLQGLSNAQGFDIEELEEGQGWILRNE